VTAEELRAAARYLLRYAAAVETKLYMDMKIPQAHAEIAEAKQLAEMLYNEAASKDDFRSIPE